MTEQASLDAIVIKNIGDIAAAMDHVNKVLLPRIWEEMNAAVERTISDQKWVAYCDPQDDDVSFAKRSWLDEDGNFELWLFLDELVRPGHDGDHWLATITGTGVNGATLVLTIGQDVLSDAKWKKHLKANSTLVEQLRKRGFSVSDEDARKVYLPVPIDAGALATAVDEGDFDTAFQLLAEAVTKTMEASAELDRLFDTLKAA